MEDREKPNADRERDADSSEDQYEVPQIEDLPASEGATVTAAGPASTLPSASPRDL